MWPWAITISTKPENSSSAALTMSQCTVMAILFASVFDGWLLPATRWLLDQKSRQLQLAGFFDGFVNGTNHVEGLLGQVVIVAIEDALEATDGFFQGNILAGRTRKHFSNEEWLGQETLDFTGT